MSEHWRRVWHITSRFFLYLFLLLCAVALAGTLQHPERKACEIKGSQGETLRLC